MSAFLHKENGFVKGKQNIFLIKDHLYYKSYLTFDKLKIEREILIAP